ncbi:DUF2683 family protein [Pedobacter frigiditerrae]|uniref:DUF2683 family protein n=1 Tax=Pedobacter frigiditerrae TaxID=2530452 RepID=UPI00293055CD|nr:DUF2683 family protein [Pedobacter frigiditerrae]
METLVIHTEGPSQTKKVKDFLKALNIKVEVVPQQTLVEEELPTYVSKLMNKALSEADEKKFTNNDEFLKSIKDKYKG